MTAAPAEHEIEDVYPLSPLQRGMLFHSLAAPKTGVYINQVVLPLSGPLDRVALRRAFQHLLERHSILRTAFEWEGIEQPVQVVHRHVDLPWFEHDFRGLDDAAREVRLQELFRSDRWRGFELSRAPALRVHLAQLAETEHVLCWTFHHILLDGWSTPIVTGELVQLYMSFAAGKPVVLPPAHPYGEYIAWIEQQDPARARDYFRELLEGFSAPLRLAIDVAVDSGDEAPEEVASAEASRVLDPGLAARVAALARKTGVTPSVVIEAAWALVLSHYAATSDVVFGTTLSGRPAELEGIESRVGLFVNTLPIRVRIDRTTTGTALLETLRDQHAELFRFQHTSLADVIALSEVPRGRRLFETVVGYQNYPVGERVRDSMRTLRLGRPQSIEHGNFAATLVVSPGADSIELVLSYVPSRFEAGSMDRALGHLDAALEQLTQNPNAPLFGFDLVRSEERESLRAWGRGPERRFPDELVPELFAEQAAIRAGAAALVEDRRTLSYRELELRVADLAARLRGMGVGPEVRVAVCLERGADLVVAILGILNAGGVYVPIDPAYPEERLAFMLDDCQAPLIVTSSALSDQLPSSGAFPIVIDEIEPDPARQTFEPPSLHPGNAAYVIYTSGSTGRPKGVVVTHGGLVNTALAQIEGFRIGSESRVLWFASPSFDASVSEMFTALLAGARLYFREKHQLMPGPELADWLDREGVSVLTLPPSALAVLPRHTLPKLATLIVAGEACPAELVRRWSTGRDFLNAYGPTETTICVSMARCAPGAGRPPIGRPIANVTAYVLDSALRLVPAGVAGELYAGGPGVARGYLGRPELTAERFVPSPFEPGERLYRTGDRVRWNLDGELEFLDRVDAQIKLRGYRIELGEIEAVLQAHPAVLQAVAIVRDEPPARKIVAYVVPDATAAGSVLDELRVERARVHGGLRCDLPDGSFVVSRSREDAATMFSEIFERNSYFQHGITLGDGACVFDVGANIGLFSLLVNRSVADARIYAFEPVPTTLEMLRVNVGLHGVTAKIFAFGLSDRSGKARFTYYDAAPGMSGRFADAKRDRELVRTVLENRGQADPMLDQLLEARLRGQEVDAELRRLSDVIREQGVERIDLLKIDVEGDELGVLRGIEDHDWPKIRQIVMEVHDLEGRVATVRSLLAGHGFEVFVAQEPDLAGTELYNVFARRGTDGADAVVPTPRPAAVASAARFESPDALERELSATLSARLPEYMVPSRVVLLPELPLGPNGKVDKHALPSPEPRVSTEEHEPPTGDAEVALAEIWCDVLHLDRVSRVAHFFELGGDSLLSIQVVSRAREHGLAISIEDVFDQPRLADLALAARAVVAPDAEQGLVTGEMPLLPVQRWFCEMQGELPHHFNMALLFQSSRSLEPSVARRAVRALLEHHDALRLRFDASKGRHVDPEQAFSDDLVGSHDLSSLADGQVREAIERIADETQRSLDVARGPLLRIVLFSLGQGRPNRLLWVVHHFVSDVVSWRVLLEDFQTACDQIERGDDVVLPAKTLSLKAYAERLREHSESEQSRAELTYWLEQLSRPAAALPVDFRRGENTNGSTEVVEAVLDAGATSKLLRGFVKSHGAHVNDVLLTGIARAIAATCGTRVVSILVETHGRETLPSVDISRTVGWFTSCYPAVLRLGDDSEVTSDLEGVIGTLRAIPRRGAGFLPLRESDGAAGEALRALPLPDVSFNHLGQAESVLEAAGPVSIAPENSGRERDPKARRPALLELASLVLAGRLRLTLMYSSSFHQKSTAEALVSRIASELELLASRAGTDADAGAADDGNEPAPSEVSDRLLPAPRDQPLPLSFSQERAWFLEQLDPGRPAYQPTFLARMRGDLDPSLLARALERVVDRHEGLRTTFPSVDGRAVQVVAARGSLALRYEDLTALEPEERARAAMQLRRELSETPLDLAKGPVGRVVLVRGAPDDYTLVIIFHLILADRWSMDLFVRELGMAYDALSRGQEPAFTPLRVHYADYAYWQRQRLSGRRLDDLVGFWRGELAELPALELPADRPRPATPLGRGARRTFRLDAEVSRAVKQLGARHGLTLFMTLLAALEALLHRLSGQERFAVGTTIANRPRPELEGVFGYFANLLVFPADCSGAPSFEALMRRVRTAALAAYAHQEMPYERIVEAISPERDPSRNPIFQVMLVLHRQHAAGMALSSVQVELPEDGEQTTAQFDLRLDMIDDAEGLYGVLEYSTELYDVETIDVWIRAYENLIRSAAERPDLPISRLALLDSESRRHLLEDLNDTRADYPSELGLHEPFFARAKETPEAVAVDAPGLTLSYRELAERATRLGAELRARGVGPGQLVAVVMHKGVEQVVATLAILAAGGAYLPVDPGLPPARVRFLLEHARAFGSIAQPDHAALGVFPGGAFNLLIDPRSYAEGPLEALARVRDAGDLAYVIYTSGSTGVPKGVALDHRGPVNTLFDINERHRISARDRVLMLSSLGFDLSVWDVFGTLAAGATIVVPQADKERDPAHWVELLAERGVTVWNSVPALFEMLVEHLEHAPLQESSLRLALLSGDWIPVSLPDRARKVFPGIELVSLGGATEASVWSIAYPIDRVDPTWRSIPYGKPLKNQRFYVLDSELEPCPIGIPGELYIGGVGLALGYYNDPDRTAESFITHPATAERLYRTGDFGRYLRSGDIEFLGRRDGQVKIRGYRIELGEIEAALRKHAAVREALVLARGAPQAERRLVAYVIPSDPALSPEALAAHVSGLLPQYMVPSAFVLLETFPLSPNGKVDRKALPEPDDRERPYIAPKGAVQELIAATWSPLLGLAQVSSDANFFELGGHSILATQAVARLRRALGTDFPLRWAFESPTVAGLAARIERALASTGERAAPALARVDRDAGLALSFSQERSWFLDQLLPGDASHRVELCARLSGRIDVACLRAAVADLVRRHPALATRLSSEAGRVVQSVQSAPEPELESARPGGPISATDDPLFRVALVRQADSEHELWLVAHRIVADRPSLELALGDLLELYRARSGGGSPNLTPLPVRFADLAEWERESAKSDAMKRKLASLRQRLGDLPALELPTDRPRPALQSFRGASVPLEVGAALSEELRALATREGTSLLGALMVAAAVVFARHSGQKELAIGSFVSGRSRPESAGVVGPLENPIALEARLDDDPSLRVLLRRMRDALAISYFDKEVPFELVVDELHPTRDTSRPAIVQASVVLHDGAVESLSAGDLSARVAPASDQVAQHEVCIELTQTSSGLRGRVLYKADLFLRSTIEHLVEHFASVLGALVERPETSVGEVELLAARERALVTSELAASPEPGLTRGSVHELIVAQAERCPEADAVVQGEGRLGYRELVSRARSVAEHLTSLGLAPEAVVGVLLERSLELPVALLGVLGAGGAYLPLEPSYPDERLRYVLNDSGARWVITTSDLEPRVRAAGCVPIDIAAISGRDEASRPFAAPCHPEQLAYLIYTSGSTGRPKGVGVPHGAFVNFLTSMQRAPGIEPSDRLLSVTSPTFDIFALELFLPLITGACVSLVPRSVALDGERLAVELELATLFQATPATYRVLLAAGWRIPEPGARTLKALCGGEALPAALAAEIRARVGELWNVYGPTETTVWSACCKLDAEPLDRAPPIGSPIGGTELYVLDARMRPVPIGVWGELYIGGSGVARGYHGRAELTAERFVPDPIGPRPGSRLYRTGDRCRWRSDGLLEFSTRLDHQIKLRGHRIELGEIEAVLAEHPGVGAAAVSLHGEGDDARLIGYLVPARGAAAVDASSDWAVPPAATPSHAWQERGVEHILDAGRPQRLLEVGSALPRDRFPNAEVASPAQLAAIAPRSFDCAALSGLVSTLPSAEQLLEVIRAAVAATRDGGTVFVGDVRSKALLEPLAFAAELADARPGMSLLELRTRARSRARFEPELVVDPELFTRLPGELDRVGAVSLRKRVVADAADLGPDRYDVLIAVGPCTPHQASRTLHYGDEGVSESRLGELLGTGLDSLVVRAVPIPRLWRALRGLEWLQAADAPRDAGELAARLGGDGGPSLLRLRTLGSELGYDVRVSAPRADGTADVVFVRAGAATPTLAPEAPSPERAPAELANDPLLAARERALPWEVRTFAAAKLPDYMLPQAYVLLDAMPLTTSGKLDRRALPVPERTEIAGELVEPADETEALVARIFADALRLDRVSTQASFFALGGHSLLGTHVIARLRNELGIELPLRALFSSPTVSGLAREVETARERGLSAAAPQVTRAHGELVLPLSYAQERMWFIDRLYSGRGVFNIPQNFRVVGEFDFGALRRAFDALTERHEALRTVIRVVDGAPAQIILPMIEVVEREIVDLSSLSREERERTVERLGNEHAGRSFDLEHGPLLHAVVLRLAPDEHAVLITMHHIVADGWSLGVLYTELTALYAAFREGRPSPLPPLELQYADYAIWQRRWMQGDVLERHVEWWKARLAGYEPLELPTDRPRPAVRDYRGAAVDLELPEARITALRELCQAEGATLFMGLTAAFLVLMHRYSGQNDITIGTALANRTRAELGGLIGFFINTPAVRADLSGRPTFREVLARVKEAALDIFEWQEAPFEKIVEALHPERDPSRYPIYNVIFGLQNLPGGQVTRAGDVRLRELGSRTGYARYDLTVQVIEHAEGLNVDWEYAVALYDRATVLALGEHFARVLELCAAEPDQPIDDTPYVSEAELDELRALGMPPAIGTEPAATIHELIFAQARRTPDAVAINALDGSTTTYRQLEQRAAAFARRLLAAGVRPGARVGIALHKSADFVAALLGALSVGACFVPLDPGYPRERLELLLSDSGTSVVLTSRALASELPSAGARVLCVEDETSGDGAALALPSIPPSAAAYIIYTSGSTGRPKGVVVPHHSVLRVIGEVDRALRPQPRKNLLWFMSPSFDATILELVLSLMAGAAVHILPRDRLLPGPELLRVLAERRIDTFIVIASALEELPQGELPELHTIIVGGEASTAESLERWAKNRRLIVAYGPTETTIIATMGPSTGSHAHYTLGRPLPGMSAFVLDASMKAVPVGVFGELYLGGDCVALGYHARPDLTAERFVPDPFAKERGLRLYKTGDRARWRRDGTLEFAGRVDQQIKLRGHRIELGEIEAALAGVGSVRHAVVLLREDTPGDKRLVAYLVSDRPEGLEIDAVRHELERVLPAYMVPSQFVVLDELPRAPTGKVDKKALAAPAPDRERSIVPPRTPLEELVAAAFATVLGQERVGVDQSFFDLGGHSLLATRLVARLRQSTGVEVPLRSVFEAPSVEQLAARIEVLSAENGLALPPLERADRSGALPLSFAQERLWFLDQLAPGLAWYNVPAVVRLRSAFDVDAFERALTELCLRQESLRTSFPSRSGAPVQRISERARPDLRRLARPGIDDAELRALVESEIRRPFDLSEGPLVRALLVSVGPQDHVVCLTLHHIVTDGWSMGVLVRELFELYAAAREGRAAVLPELVVQYADYAVWQRSWLTGEVLERQLAFFRDRLGDVESLELPLDRPRPKLDAHQGAVVPVELDAELANDLRRRAADAGVTPFMFLLAAFGALLGRLAGQTKFAIGFPIAGRRHADVERLIGFFVNTLLARIDLEGRPTFRELCARVRTELLGAYAHQDVPFEKVVQELALERDTAKSPLFQVAFMLDRQLDVPEAGPLGMSAVPAELGTAKLDLSLSLIDAKDGIGGALEYNVALFDKARIERMLGAFVELVRAVVRDPDRRIDELSLVTSDEREQLLALGRGHERLEPNHERLVHELVRERVQTQPEAPAIVDHAEVVSYRELAERAARIAGGLARLGIGPEQRVALALDRGADLTAAMLGVLETGAAYVPVDPELPAERRAFMLRDSGAELVIVDAITRRLDWPDVRCVDIGELRRAEALAPTELRSPANPDLAAYVIYTSGSTGLPKGVVVSHRGLVNTVLAQIEGFAIRADSRVLAFASPSFDASASEVFTTLIAGGALHVRRAEELLPGPELAAYLEQARISVVTLPPSALALLPPGRLPDLGTLIVAGEACSEQLISAWAADRRFVNAYGPTEASICATLGTLAPGDRVTIGQALPNTDVYVLDERLTPVPAGVWGQLFLGGRGVARGYHGRPDLSAERFVPDPFASRAGARMYRTGDRARWRDDGRLELGGRFDEQVKLRGFRIELGEVEATLLDFPGVEQAAVVVRDDLGESRQLVAYASPCTLSVAELRAHLSRRLPVYMQPAKLVLLDGLPRTTSGKLDRRALPVPETERRAVSPPQTELERTLATAYSELLGVEAVGRDQGFFELGGHSLLAAQLRARIERETGRPIPLGALFQSRLTVAELAEIVEHAGAGTETGPIVTLSAGAGEPVFAIHRAASHVLGYRRLAQHLRAHPVYGVLPPGLGAGETCPASIGEIADRHTSTILAATPRGRIHLVGHSMGGFIALETARRLLARGAEVGLVALVDTIWPSAELARETELELGRPIPGASELERHQALVRSLVRATLAYAENDVELQHPLLLVEVEGPAEQRAARAASRERWRSTARGGIAIERVSGDHESALEAPHVDEVARLIMQYIAKVAR